MEIHEMPALNIPEDYIRTKEGNINPFQFDNYHMGHNFSRTILLMYANHPEEQAEYLILVNKKTGKRYKLEFPEDWQ